ncbi:MAG: GWxTD domain-containing protein, partial [Candidatus Aminicenantes bacterium]|nr:GWxTD domain-containing protein [Candidatus Aminicenantes bacterium]
DVFLKLTSDRERDLFIEAFWKHRDPIPGTPENEFKAEHLRRISHANRFFGRTSPRPGWRTDRGRIYIILGEPNDIQRFEGKTQTYPAEVWFYQDKAGLGLPPGFYVVFFQEGGIGEFKLYSPAGDGPQALLTNPDFDPIDYVAAYKKLREFEPDLADVSISLVPGEDRTIISRPSLASDMLIQRVETTPQRQVEELYARKFLEYKDIVEVEYTANYMNCESLVKVFKDPSGLDFVHFAIEPARLSVGQAETRYYANLRLNGSVTTPEGKPVYQFERAISINLDKEKLARAGRQPLNIHDMFPLIPGDYRLSLLLKNEVSKEFTSHEQAIVVPREDAGVRLTSLLLGYGAAEPEKTAPSLKPFRFGAFRVRCQPNRVFLAMDTLCLAFQVHGLPDEARDKAELKFTFLKDEQEFRSFARKASDYPGLPNVLEEVVLSDYAPAHYRVRVSLTIDGAEAASASDEFDVTPLAAIRRPWFHSQVQPPSSEPIYDYLVGTQLFNSGRLDEAIVRLERAGRSRPDSLDFALNLARAYMGRRMPEKIAPLFQPFMGADKPPSYDVYFLQGKACQELGEWERAIEMFEAAISQYGISPTLLNAAGECYFERGDVKAALAAWSRSLELDPDQEVIRKRIDTLKGKESRSGESRPAGELKNNGDRWRPV